MILTPNALFTGIMFLALGVAVLYAFNAALYPVLAERHELAKVTQTQGRSPRVLSNMLWAASLIVLPLVGLALGHQHIVSLPGLN